MLTYDQIVSAQKLTYTYLLNAGTTITLEELDRIEVADFGLGELDTTGLQLLVYLNKDRDIPKNL